MQGRARKRDEARQPIELSESEQQDLVALLKALSSMAPPPVPAAPEAAAPPAQ